MLKCPHCGAPLQPVDYVPQTVLGGDEDYDPLLEVTCHKCGKRWNIKASKLHMAGLLRTS
jgi:hypothetical protein